MTAITPSACRSRREAQVVENPALAGRVGVQGEAERAVLERLRERRQRRRREREAERRVLVLGLAGQLDLPDVLVEHVAGRAAEVHLQRPQIELVRLVAGDEEV